MPDLEHFYRGKLVQAGKTIEGRDYMITATSANLLPEEAAAIYQIVNVGSHNNVRTLDSLQMGYGFAKYDAQRFVVSLLYKGAAIDRGYPYPEYHCLCVPSGLITNSNFNVRAFIQLLKAQPTSLSNAEVISDLRPIAFTNSGVSVPVALDILLNPPFSPAVISLIVDSLITGRAVLFKDADPDAEWRLNAALAIAGLFPPNIRHELTFATEVFNSAECLAQLKFQYKSAALKTSERDVVIELGTAGSITYPPEQLYTRSIVPYLTARRLADLAAFVEQPFFKQARDLSVRNIPFGTAVSTALIRHQYDQKGSAELRVDDLALLLTYDNDLKPDKAQQVAEAIFKQAVSSDRPDLHALLQSKGFFLRSPEQLAPVITELVDQGYALPILQVLSQLPVDEAANKPSRASLAGYTSQLYMQSLAHKQDGESFVSFLAHIDALALTNADLKTLWPEALRTFKLLARQHTSVAQTFFQFTALEANEFFLDFLRDLAVNPNWHPELSQLAKRLTVGSAEPNDTQDLLTDASRLFDHAAASVFLVLVQTAAKNNPSLINHTILKHVRNLAAQSPAYREQAERLGGLDEKYFTRTFDVHVLLGLMELRIALNMVDRAVVLIEPVINEALKNPRPEQGVRWLEMLAKVLGPLPASRVLLTEKVTAYARKTDLKTLEPLKNAAAQSAVLGPEKEALNAIALSRTLLNPDQLSQTTSGLQTAVRILDTFQQVANIYRPEYQVELNSLERELRRIVGGLPAQERRELAALFDQLALLTGYEDPGVGSSETGSSIRKFIGKAIAAKNEPSNSSPALAQVFRWMVDLLV